jgi:hypothetical protein
VRQKSAGVPGNTVVGFADSTGRNANFEVKPRLASVAKADFEKGWTIAKFVAQRGVQVLLLG